MEATVEEEEEEVVAQTEEEGVLEAEVTKMEKATMAAIKMDVEAITTGTMREVIKMDISPEMKEIALIDLTGKEIVLTDPTEKGIVHTEATEKEIVHTEGAVKGGIVHTEVTEMEIAHTEATVMGVHTEEIEMEAQDGADLVVVARIEVDLVEVCNIKVINVTN